MAHSQSNDDVPTRLIPYTKDSADCEQNIASRPAHEEVNCCLFTRRLIKGEIPTGLAEYFKQSNLIRNKHCEKCYATYFKDGSTLADCEDCAVRRRFKRKVESYELPSAKDIKGLEKARNTLRKNVISVNNELNDCRLLLITVYNAIISHYDVVNNRPFKVCKTFKDGTTSEMSNQLRHSIKEYSDEFEEYKLSDCIQAVYNLCFGLVQFGFSVSLYALVDQAMIVNFRDSKLHTKDKNVRQVVTFYQKIFHSVIDDTVNVPLVLYKRDNGETGCGFMKVFTQGKILERNEIKKSETAVRRRIIYPCPNCLQDFERNERLQKHLEYCKGLSSTKLQYDAFALKSHMDDLRRRSISVGFMTFDFQTIAKQTHLRNEKDPLQAFSFCAGFVYSEAIKQHFQVIGVELTDFFWYKSAADPDSLDKLFIPQILLDYEIGKLDHSIWQRYIACIRAGDLEYVPSLLLIELKIVRSLIFAHLSATFLAKNFALDSATKKAEELEFKSDISQGKQLECYVCKGDFNDEYYFRNDLYTVFMLASQIADDHTKERFVKSCTFVYKVFDALESGEEIVPFITSQMLVRSVKIAMVRAALPKKNRHDLYSVENIENIFTEVLPYCYSAQEDIVDLHEEIPDRLRRDEFLKQFLFYLTQIRNSNAVVCHHFVTGQILGMAHEYCHGKWRYDTPTDFCEQSIETSAHNLKNFDLPLIVRALDREVFQTDILMLGKRSDKIDYVYLSKLIFFKDSYNFIPDNLSNIGKNLKGEGKELLNTYTRAFIEFEYPFLKDDDLEKAVVLLCGKGCFPYEMITSLDVLTEEREHLPDRHLFYSRLTNSAVSEENYSNSLAIYKLFRCKNLEDLNRIYSRTYGSVLSAALSKYYVCMEKEYLCDLKGFTSACSLSDHVCKMTNHTIIQKTPNEQVQNALNACKRGGHSSCGHRKGFNSRLIERGGEKFPLNNGEKIFVTTVCYVKENSQYAQRQLLPLPIGAYKVHDDIAEGFDFKTFYDTSLKTDPYRRFLVQFDATLPDEFHDGPESTMMSTLYQQSVIPPTMLSPYQLCKRREQCKNNAKKYNKITSTCKSHNNILDKNNLWEFGDLLRYAISRGYVVKVRSMISFIVQETNKAFVQSTLNKRVEAKKAGDDTASCHFKLMVNSLFGAQCRQDENDYKIKPVFTSKSCDRDDEPPRRKPRCFEQMEVPRDSSGESLEHTLMEQEQYRRIRDVTVIRGSDIFAILCQLPQNKVNIKTNMAAGCLIMSNAKLRFLQYIHAVKDFFDELNAAKSYEHEVVRIDPHVLMTDTDSVFFKFIAELMPSAEEDVTLSEVFIEKYIYTLFFTEFKEKMDFANMHWYNNLFFDDSRNKEAGLFRCDYVDKDIKRVITSGAKASCIEFADQTERRTLKGVRKSANVSYRDFERDVESLTSYYKRQVQMQYGPTEEDETFDEDGLRSACNAGFDNKVTQYGFRKKAQHLYLHETSKRTAVSTDKVYIFEDGVTCIKFGHKDMNAALAEDLHDEDKILKRLNNEKKILAKIPCLKNYSDCLQIYHLMTKL